MPGVVELKLAELYRNGSDPPPVPQSTAHVAPYQVRDFETAVRAALRAGRISMEDGREELRLLRLCHEALGESKGATIPIVIAKAEDQRPVRKLRPVTKEKQRQKSARRLNRRKKKGKR